MPFYDYKCLECQEKFELLLPIAKRKKPEKDPCPSCGVKRVKQVIESSPNVGVDLGKDIHKTSGAFKEVMQRVAEAPGMRGKRSAEFKARYNL
jgi:putative FmdB family regulatory protein